MERSSREIDLTWNDVVLFADTDCDIAENPLWNESEQLLYWRGNRGEIYRKALEAPADRFECDSPQVGRIGGFVFTERNRLLLFAEFGKVWLWRPGDRPELVAELPGAHEGTLFNDVIADPEGGVFCGVLADYFFLPEKRAPHGSMWYFDRNGRFEPVESDAGITPNGMAFSPDRKTFYFGITDHNCVYSYAYGEGKLSGKRNLFPAHSSPDGLTVDAAGNIWTTNCNPFLTCHSPEGELLAKFRFPPEVRSTTSCIFGGPDLSTLFITTMNYPRCPDFLDGKVFALKTDTRGLPEFRTADKR